MRDREPVPDTVAVAVHPEGERGWARDVPDVRLLRGRDQHHPADLGRRCFTAFTAETRSSTPFDAVLKDFLIGDLDTCVRDVSVEKTPDGGTANAGDTITFEITVNNESPNSDAGNVTLIDTLPNSGLTWTIATQPAGSPCSIAGTPQVLSCNFGTLGVGESRTATISSPTDAADCGAKNKTR